ncbi:ornithine cyclodeaminase family protein, partial [Salmonella enterica subsp. enterica]|nr:ornithine cyclodeaminase family protein [Salmonella enterica subsp. enterica serovar Enteritidis]
MIIVPERLIAGLMTDEAVFTAIENTFAAMARGEARNFPVIREAIGYADALYGFKSGFDKAGLVLGLKSGGYWPGNMDKGLTNHQSTVLLFDPDTGRIKAAVGGNLLTALRTAAASAVSIKHLAREDARVLGMVGAGHQSAFQMKAAARVRKFDKVVGWNLHKDMLTRLADTAAELGLPFEAVELPELGKQADVIITITSSFAPIV